MQGSGNSWAWAAGLYEGEGCLCVTRSEGRPPSIQLSLSMDEEWPVRKFTEITGVHLHGPYGPYGKSERHRWQARLYKRSEIARVLWGLKDYLGPRRRDQIKRVVREVRKGRREFYAANPDRIPRHT
jgi:hypothetical protein